MAQATPSVMPQSFVRGTTVRWAYSHDDYPADEGWSQSYYFRGPSTASLTCATVPGAEYQACLTATVTGAMNPGVYEWQCFSRKANLRFMVEAGTIEATTDLSTLSESMKSRDARTTSRRMLDNLREILEDRASVLRMEPGKVAETFDSYKRALFEVRLEEEKERRARGENVTNKMVVRFTG